jgi:hypothetical protein
MSTSVGANHHYRYKTSHDIEEEKGLELDNLMAKYYKPLRERIEKVMRMVNETEMEP